MSSLPLILFEVILSIKSFYCLILDSQCLQFIIMIINLMIINAAIIPQNLLIVTMDNEILDIIPL
jgi:hypothetical protein